VGTPLTNTLSKKVSIWRFETMIRFGGEAAFVSAGGYHHHIGLNTWESLGGSPPPPGTTGLYHVAILYPTRAELADALTRVIKAGITLDGASDHGVSEALTSAIQIKMAWNCIGIAPASSGHDRLMDN
jgi:catechol 2,3-dioxygenase